MADEERRLVEVAQRGDVESFNELVRLFEGRVYNLCYRMLGDADSAADAAQDAFLSAFRNLRSFRGGSFRSWMLRIATNTCYDVLRVRKRRPSVSLDIEADDESASSPLQIADTAESPDDFAQRRELAAAIQQGLTALPDEQRCTRECRPEARRAAQIHRRAGSTRRRTASWCGSRRRGHRHKGRRSGGA